MNLRLRHFLSKQTIVNLSRLNSIAATSLSGIFSPSELTNNRNAIPPPFLLPKRSFHSSPELKFTATQASVVAANDQDFDAHYEEEAAMNEFLSRFVHQMRGKLNEAYPSCDKQTVDSMLVVIVEKLVAQMEKGQRLEEMEMSVDFSDDLWQTVLEVSNAVYQDMEREKKKERMRKFLQSEDVKAMARFASEVGVRGDMLRELRFKWAGQAMEESEFYESLERLLQEEDVDEAKIGKSLGEQENAITGKNGSEVQGEGGGSGGLPKRHGKIKYKLYGLDLSGPKWKEVADKIHDAGEVIWPQETKPITGKCRLVTENILTMGKDDDFLPLLAEWVELLQPNRVDWISLLEKLKQRDESLYLKVVEHVLSEPSFLADIRDYSKLIDIHAKENRLEDVERILEKLSENGVLPDTIILTALVHMYSKAGNLKRAKEAYETLRSQGFKPDLQVHQSMIIAYVNAGQPKLGEGLLREIETRDIKPTEEICMALLRGFAQRGDKEGASRMDATMKFAGYQPTLESCTLLVEACAKCGNSNTARNMFDYMRDIGIKPDDRSIAMMVYAYEKTNELDKALNLLLKLEKDGFEPGVSTYCVLVDWLGKLQLVDEAEQMLERIAQLGEAPPFKIQVSLCDMYSRAGIEKKTLQTLGVLEGKKEILEREDFERVIQGLLKGGFIQDAWRIHGLMEAQGYKVSESISISLMSTQAFGRGRGSGSGSV